MVVVLGKTARPVGGQEFDLELFDRDPPKHVGAVRSRHHAGFRGREADHADFGFLGERDRRDRPLDGATHGFRLGDHGPEEGKGADDRDDQRLHRRTLQARTSVESRFTRPKSKVALANGKLAPPNPSGAGQPAVR
jgi:hypothetical protein